MLSCGVYCFIWLTAFCRVKRFFDKIISIGSRTIKFIPWGKLIIHRLLFLVRICLFFSEMWFISGISIKGLIIRSINFISIFNWVFRHRLFREFIFILGFSLKRNIFPFVFYSWDNLLSHLRLMTRIVIFIWSINIPIRLIRIGF